MKRVATCIIAVLSAYNGALTADEAVFVEKGNAGSVQNPLANTAKMAVPPGNFP